MIIEGERLEDMCELVVDCPHSTPKWTESGYLVIRNSNIRNGRLNLSSKSYTNEIDYLKRIRRAKPKAGDIIFTREAPMGEVCMVPDGLECCVGQRQVLLRPRSDLSGKYLFYALQSRPVQHQIFWNEGTGSTVSNVRIPVLKDLRIPRRGSDEDKIANFISLLDQKYDLNQETNETLEAMAQAIFKDWFVDFGPVKRKASGVSDPVKILGGLIPDPDKAEPIAKLFPDSFGDNGLPEGWEKQTLEDILTLNYGKSLPKKKRIPGPYPVYGSGGENGTHESSIVEGPGVIVGRKGTVGSLYWETRDFFPIDTVFYVVPKSGFSFVFIWQLLQTLGLKEMNTDAAVPGLNRNNAYRLEIPKMSENIIAAFTEICAPLRRKIDANEKENQTLAETRDYLLPRLMSGDVRVADLDEVA